MKKFNLLSELNDFTGGPVIRIGISIITLFIASTEGTNIPYLPYYALAYGITGCWGWK